MPAAGAARTPGPGLYDSRFEHDACGVGLVADLSGRRTHDTVAQALTVLRNLDHRGAKGSDPETGDGAGILTQLPDAFFRSACGFGLPAAGFYAAGMAFLPTDAAAAAAAMATVERIGAHDGELNTVRGNRNWMRAREAMLATGLIPAAADGAGLERLLPILDADASDSASFDECLELLHLGGRSLPHAILMMIPEPWENHEAMDPARRAFYRFHAAVMEPWDGPACVAFTDGTLIGAVLDRNGLRPSRYWVTHDGLVILASEVGVLDIDPANVIRKGRLQPGRIFLADTASRRILEDGDVKAALAAEHPYQDW